MVRVRDRVRVRISLRLTLTLNSDYTTLLYFTLPLISQLYCNIYTCVSYFMICDMIVIMIFIYICVIDLF